MIGDLYLLKLALIIRFFITIEENVLYTKLVCLYNLGIGHLHCCLECVVSFTPSRLDVPKNLQTPSILIDPILSFKSFNLLFV